MLLKREQKPQQAPQAPADDLIKDVTVQSFRADVLEASRQTPVIVDFWAPWCGPCKQLTPILEKAVRAARGKALLRKMNVDEHPAIAGQLGVKSIPAVFVFRNGQPVDGFVGALPEAQIKAFLDRVTANVADDLDAILAEADAAALAGDPQTAAELYAVILGEKPDDVPALAGLAKAVVALGDVEAARDLLARIPAAKAGDPRAASARAAIELAEASASLGDSAALERRLAADPLDHQARFDLALALNAGGRREEALTHLIDLVRRDRAWNEDAARKQLLQFFDAWGPKDPLTLSGRRKLSSILFS